LLPPEEIVALGDLLATPRLFADDAIVVADLTGLPAQNAAIAGVVWRAFQPAENRRL
jgi:ornithine cyclodeaminase